MNKLVTKIATVLVALFISMNALGNGEDVTIMIAGADGTISFAVDYSADAFLLAGFDESPLVLDVTDEEAPVIVSYISVETGNDFAAYTALDSGSSIFAASAGSFIEVDQIDLY